MRVHQWSRMHDLSRLSDEVLASVERCAWDLHQVHDDFGAIDTDTHVKISTLLVDARADMERRGLQWETSVDTDRQDADESDPEDEDTDGMVREYTEARGIARAHDAHARLSPGDRI